MVASLPPGSQFSQLLIYTSWVCSHMCFNFPGGLVSVKKIFKDLLFAFLCDNSTPPLYCPTLPLGNHAFHDFEFTLAEDAFT